MTGPARWIGLASLVFFMLVLPTIVGTYWLSGGWFCLFWVGCLVSHLVFVIVVLGADVDGVTQSEIYGLYDGNQNGRDNDEDRS